MKKDSSTQAKPVKEKATATPGGASSVELGHHQGQEIINENRQVVEVEDRNQRAPRAVNVFRLSLFEKELRDDIAERKGKSKAPVVTNTKVEKFIAQCVKLRCEPDWKLAGVILGRIRDAELYLLSNSSYEQFVARLYPQIKEQLGEQADDHGTQADTAAEVQTTDAPTVVQTDRVGQDVTKDSASKSAIRTNGKLDASVVASRRPEKYVPELPLDRIDDKAQSQKPNLQPASAVAVSTLPGANPSGPLAGPPQQPPAPAKPETIEILYGKFRGVYRVHPVAAMFEMLKDKPAQDFKTSISTDGQKEPVIIDGDVLLDGRNRVRALNELGRETLAVQFSALKMGVTQDKLIEIKNLQRRDVSDDQRIAIVARIIAWRKEEAARNRLKCRAAAQPTTIASTTQSASPQSATGENQEAAKPGESEYQQKPAENTPKRKRGRPRGRRSEAKAVAAETKQSRYRAEWTLKLQDEAPDLAEAVQRGELKLKAAIARLKERRKPQPTDAPVAKPQRIPDEQRVKDAISAGLRGLREIMRKKQVRTWERVPFWRGIADLARREAAM